MLSTVIVTRKFRKHEMAGGYVYIGSSKKFALTFVIIYFITAS